MNSQFSPFLRQLLPILLLSQLLYGCGLFDDPTTTTSVSCSPNCSVPTTAVGGKLAQSYVRRAQVWADRLVGGVGDLKWQNDEPLAVSGNAGDYQLSGISGDFLLITYGGKKQDSSGNWIDAIPMVAPAPVPGQATTNVTPLTTLVAFEPALKNKLAAYGDWNADIASPSGINGNLLRIAKTVETLSSVVSGGNAPLISDFNANLKSLGVLATQLKTASGDLASEAVLQASAANALTTIVSDSTLVPNPLTSSQRSTLVGSLEQAVQGITAAIPANGVVVEDSTLLAQIETVLQAANISDSVAVTLSMGGGNLNFGAVITQIKMELSESTLVLTADVPDDDPDSLDYNWSTTSPSFGITDASQPTAQVMNFDGTNLQVRLTVIDNAAGNFTDNVSCAWKGNPTTCEF